MSLRTGGLAKDDPSTDSDQTDRSQDVSSSDGFSLETSRTLRNVSRVMTRVEWPASVEEGRWASLTVETESECKTREKTLPRTGLE